MVAGLIRLGTTIDRLDSALASRAGALARAEGHRESPAGIPRGSSRGIPADHSDGARRLAASIGLTGRVDNERRPAELAAWTEGLPGSSLNLHETMTAVLSLHEIYVTRHSLIRTGDLDSYENSTAEAASWAKNPVTSARIHRSSDGPRTNALFSEPSRLEMLLLCPQPDSPNFFATNHGVVVRPHLPARAKRVIHLCMAGGPRTEASILSPKLKRLDGQPFPESFTKGHTRAAS